MAGKNFHRTSNLPTTVHHPSEPSCNHSFEKKGEEEDTSVNDQVPAVRYKWNKLETK